MDQQEAASLHTQEMVKVSIGTERDSWRHSSKTLSLYVLALGNMTYRFPKTPHEEFIFKAHSRERAMV